MDLTAINKLAFDEFGTKSSHPFKEKGNKYYHGQRTAKLALTLKKVLFPDSGGDDILTVAAWFHDIKNGENDHAKAGAAHAAELLAPFCSRGEIEQICEIIYSHDDRRPDNNYSDLLKLHQDADHLDHFGTFDVWCTVLYALSQNMTMNDVAETYVNDRPAERKKYLAELNYEVSKRIFDEKFEFIEYFGKRFAAESAGNVWNLDGVLNG